MICRLCSTDFPPELIKPVEFMGAETICCPICALDFGGVKGMNWRRAVLHVEFLRKQEEIGHAVN